jgi:hypothetical protein
MISAVEWVPAGVADPSPKKYEFSPAELELIELMEEHNMQDLHEVQAHLGKQQEKQDKEEESAEKKKKKEMLNREKKQVENTLPADLRMDEYSSDEEDNEAVRGTAIGRLLVERDEGMDDMQEEENEEDEDLEYEDGRVSKTTSRMNHSDNDESDDDDDLDDVPDTREYTPVDLEGLKAIGLSQVGTNAPSYMDDFGADDDENDSEAEDVMIRPDDAIVVVAKTEEVSQIKDITVDDCLFLSLLRTRY